MSSAAGPPPPSLRRCRSHPRCPQHVETPSSFPLRCDGTLIRDFELRARVYAPTLFRAVSSRPRLRDPTSLVKPWAARLLRDLTPDSFVAPGDQGDGLSCIVIYFLPQAHISF